MTTEPTPQPAPTDQPDTAVTDPLPAPAPVTTAKGVRLGTVIWGLVLAACGVGVVVGALGHRFDLGLAAIVVLAAAGLALLVASLVRAVRRP